MHASDGSWNHQERVGYKRFAKLRGGDMTDIERLEQENERLQKLNQKLAVHLRAAIEQCGSGNTLALRTQDGQLAGYPANYDFEFTQDEEGDWVVKLVDASK